MEDTIQLRQVLVTTLSVDPRFTIVGETGDGQEAIEAASKLRPDVILMDVTLPGIDGLSATRQIKRTNPTIRVIVLTGYGDKRVEEASNLSGADAFFDKTTSLADVADALASLCTTH